MNKIDKGTKQLKMKEKVAKKEKEKKIGEEKAKDKTYITIQIKSTVGI